MILWASAEKGTALTSSALWRLKSWGCNKKTRFTPLFPAHWRASGGQSSGISSGSNLKN